MIPTAPGRLPLLGHAHLVAGDPRRFLLSIADLGPVVRVYLGGQPSYALTTAELIRDVSLGRAGEFHRDALRDAISDLVTGATNVLSGAEHDLRRRMIAPVFRQGRLTEYAGTVADIADGWGASLPAGEHGDLRPSVHDLVMRTMFATLFRSDADGAQLTYIRQRVPWLLSEVIVRGALPAPARRLRFWADRRFVAQSREVRAAMTGLIDARRDDPDRGDMLSALLGYVDSETGARLSDDDLVDEVLLALAAGIGSQSSIFSWLIYEVARSPVITERLYAELDSVGSSGPFLRNVLTETLRVWAPWITLLTARGPVHLDGVDLPDGTNILFSAYQVHHQDRYFPNAAVFDPDRWDDEPDDRGAMMPFGLGKRHCPGNHFALLSLTRQAAALFTRWRVELPPDFEIKVRGRDFVLAPARLPVRLTPR
ncbi:cytochrome P450 [Mycobacterium sp. C31M]